MDFVRSCLHHQSSVVKSVAQYRPTVFYTVITARLWGAISLRLQRHSFKHSRFASASCTCTDVQYTVCSLLPDCLKVRDGLLKLPDCFSPSDINNTITYLSIRRDVDFLKVFCVHLLACAFTCHCVLLLFLCTSCTIFIINKITSKFAHTNVYAHACTNLKY